MSERWEGCSSNQDNLRHAKLVRRKAVESQSHSLLAVAVQHWCGCGFFSWYKSELTSSGTITAFWLITDRGRNISFFVEVWKTSIKRCSCGVFGHEECNRAMCLQDSCCLFCPVQAHEDAHALSFIYLIYLAIPLNCQSGAVVCTAAWQCTSTDKETGC